MPAPVIDSTEPDWSSLRAASVAVGVREAARQASSHLPPEEQTRFVERVMKRCSREGWIQKANQAIIAASSQAMPLSAQVRNGAEIVANVLIDRHKETRLGLSKWSSKAATKLGEMDGEDALQAAPVAKLTADVMSKVWPEQQQAGQGVVVNIALLGNPPE